MRWKDEELIGLYDMIPSSKNFFDDDSLLHFRRSICSYLPQFLSKYLHRTIQMVIPVEKFSQIKAITKARKINHDIAPNIYLDMPSITCKNRMHRSPNGKVFLFSGEIET